MAAVASSSGRPSQARRVRDDVHRLLEEYRGSPEPSATLIGEVEAFLAGRSRPQPTGGFAD
jgi:hypothetical protein